MGYKVAIQFKGLTRQSSPKGKHRANGRGILGEMGMERASRTCNLRREDSRNNIYWWRDPVTGEQVYKRGYDISDSGSASGFAMWDRLEKAANEEMQAVNCKMKTGESVTRYRHLRSDAVIAVACIIKPPREMLEEIYLKGGRDAVSQFFYDAEDCMAAICPQIFRIQNQVFGAWHMDEGLSEEWDIHEHAVYTTKDENGHYCGHLVRSKWLSEFNEKFPEMMRQKGWDLDDLNTTDWKRYKSDKAYRNERNIAISHQGKDVNTYINEKAIRLSEQAEENFENSAEILEAASKEKAALEDEKSDFAAMKTKKEKRLRERENSVDIRERAVISREAELDVSVLNQRKLALDEKEKSLDEKKKSLDELNESLGTWEIKINKALKNLETVKKDANAVVLDADAAYGKLCRGLQPKQSDLQALKNKHKTMKNAAVAAKKSREEDFGMEF